MPRLPVKQYFDPSKVSVPEQWSSAWFRSFATNFLNPIRAKLPLKTNFGNNTNVSAWMHAGNITLNAGSSMTLVWHAGQGYSSGSNQQSVATIVIRAGDGTTAPNISGISVIQHGASVPVLAIRAVAANSNTNTGNTTWDLYIQCAAHAFGPLEAVVNVDYGDQFVFNMYAATPGTPASAYVNGAVGSYLDPTQGSGLDGMREGTTYARFKAAYLDGTKRVNAAAGALSPSCSFATNVPNLGISYTSTTTSLSLTWSAFTLYYQDGTSVTIAANPTGGYAISGLTASTTYKLYPYIDPVAQTVGFTAAAGGVGTPAVCYTAANASAAALANGQEFIPLNVITATTTASGSGGGGGDQYGCLHALQPVQMANGCSKLATDLQPGDLLPAPGGPTPLRSVLKYECAEWVRITVDDGTTVTVSRDHRFIRPDDAQVHASDLTVGSILVGTSRFLEVTELRLVKGRAAKVVLEVDAPHLYYLEGILSHNIKP